LKVNYRTSQQIRSHSDRLLDSQLADGDGNVSSRLGTISVFEGPDPDIHAASTSQDEVLYVGKWIVSMIKTGITPEEIGVIVRSESEFDRAKKAVETSGERYQVMTGDEVRGSHGITIVTMHVAKGMEFRAVVVMACDEEVIPSTERIDSVGVYLDIQEVYDTERHLFYVACTRARERLLVSGVEPISEFVMDMMN
jgi:superfamily I DNA/RNA helicase